MYPIDARQLVNRETHGSRALDRTLAHRPPRRRVLTRALTALRGSSPARAGIELKPHKAPAGCP